MPRSPPTTPRQVWLRNLPGLIVLVGVAVVAGRGTRATAFLLVSIVPWVLVWLGITWVWARRVAAGVDRRAWRWRALAEVLVVVGAVSLVTGSAVVVASGWPPLAYLLLLLPLPMLGLGLWGLRRFPVPPLPPRPPAPPRP